MRKKKLEKPVTLFAAILERQYEGLRAIAYQEKKSLAEVTREAIEAHIKLKTKKNPNTLQDLTQESSN